MTLSLRELFAAIEGSRKEQWGYLSHVLAYIHNAFAKRAKQPDDFDPTKADAFNFTMGAAKSVTSVFKAQADELSSG